MKHRITTVTQEGMTPSQPGTSVSVTSGMGKHILHVTRHYHDLPNQWGGKGRFKRLDCDGMEFASSEEAFAYAYRRGYTQRYYRKARLTAHHA